LVAVLGQPLIAQSPKTTTSARENLLRLRRVDTILNYANVSQMNHCK
jgi:hypothetical protein